MITTLSIGIAAAFVVPGVHAQTTAGAAGADSTISGGTSSKVPTAQQLADPNWISAGKDRFAHTCSYWHGQEGDAGKTRPFREHLGWDAEEIFTTITEGRRRGANIMPSWKGALSDEEIWQVVAYIKRPRPPHLPDLTGPAADGFIDGGL